jgi:hypothetical protein
LIQRKAVGPRRRILAPRRAAAMFETAVVGVIAPNPRGVTRSCIECRAGQRSPEPCGGFGPGCLVSPRPQQAPGWTPEALSPGARIAPR